MPLTSSLVKLAAALVVSVDQLVAGIEWKVAGPPLRALGEDDPWDPGKEGGDATKEA
ncbi:MAG TPA: hypothetical protein VGI17_09795 [Solirubrobacterales bacterium]|jgi:hypothetical protein